MPCPEQIVQLWKDVLDSFRDEYSTTAYELWFASLLLQDFDTETHKLTFEADSQAKREILEAKYTTIIEERFYKLSEITVHVVFTCSVPIEFSFDRLFQFVENPRLPSEPPENIKDGAEMALRSRYTFDNFIVGDSNRFARAVCWKVANHPSDEYNPLFLYGPSGVGKTHLMYAVINQMRSRMPYLKVIYTKGDDFINHMVDSLAHKEMAEFQEHYRQCDVLLVDDIQFIAGKVATQTELFHTFQTLFDDNKQIILASDRPPKDINPLEERLRSRFEQGLLADINPPDLELRVAIVKTKADALGLELPGNVLSYLAENLRTNIRQIEGALKKLAAKCMIDGRQVTMELARECIADFLGDAEPVNVIIDKIFSSVFRKTGVSKEELTGKKRSKEIAQARHIAIYLIREITEISLPSIGKIFERDHATVLASIEKVKRQIIADPLFALDIETLQKEVTGQS